MSEASPSGQAQRRRARSTRPPALVFLGLFLSLVLVHFLTRGGGEHTDRVTVDGGGPARAPGWVAHAELTGTDPDGTDPAMLRARLTRLHAAPERQRFDAETLRERLALGPGEAWRLELALEGDAETPLALGAISVADADGTALVPAVERAEAPAPNAVADPLRALAAAGDGLVWPGEPRQVLLWGRAPRDDARLILGGLDAPLALEPRDVELDALPESLARLPAPPPRSTAR